MDGQRRVADGDQGRSRDPREHRPAPVSAGAPSNVDDQPGRHRHDQPDAEDVALHREGETGRSDQPPRTCSVVQARQAVAMGERAR
jgi:hypothetical protein